MYSKMPTERKISIFFGFGWPSNKLFIGCNRKLWLNADDILYSALKVIKLFLEERLTRGNFPIVMQGIRTMFS